MAESAPSPAADGPATAAPPPKTWIPLESNPRVITAFARRLGMPRALAFHDVLGLDDELLSMLPRPVHSLILLFPITAATEAHAKGRDAELAARGAPEAPEGVFYMRQTVGNACGTIAMLHALGNCPREVREGGAPRESGGNGGGDDGTDGGDGGDERSFLPRFFAATASLTPAERGAFLERPPPGAPDLEAAHGRAAERGDTAAPGAGEDVDLHFVALIPAQGRVWELDGRRRAPVDHGPCAGEGEGEEGEGGEEGGGDGDDAPPPSFLAAAACVAREYMAREEAAGGSIAFNLIALGPADEDEEDEKEMGAGGEA